MRDMPQSLAPLLKRLPIPQPQRGQRAFDGEDLVILMRRASREQTPCQFVEPFGGRHSGRRRDAKARASLRVHGAVCKRTRRLALPLLQQVAHAPGEIFINHSNAKNPPVRTDQSSNSTGRRKRACLR